MNECPTDTDGFVQHMFVVGQPTCECGKVRKTAELDGLRQRWTLSYKEEARSDALLLMEDLKKHQPPKYVLALEQLIDAVRAFPLTEPAGPDDE